MLKVFQSLTVKVCVAAAAVFAAGLTIAGVVAFFAMSTLSEESHTSEASAAIRDGLGTLREVRSRMALYTDFLARHPEVIAAIGKNDSALLEGVLVREFKALQAADPTVATLEATDARGVVVMRGHNPARKGDDKGKLPQIKSALSGQAAAGLTVSPTSGEAAEDSVRPVKSAGTVVGTLKIGSYFKSATAAELKKKTGLEIVFVAGGKITEATLPKDALAATAQIKGAPLESAQAFRMEVQGRPYAARFVHVPSDTGDGMIIGFFSDRTAALAARDAFVGSLVMKGALAFAVMLPVIVWLATFGTRQLLRLSDVMKRIAEGHLDTQVPYAGRTDEMGAMARAVEVFKTNAIERQRLEAEQHDLAAQAAATRTAEMAQLADSFESAIGRVVETVSSTSVELEAAAASLGGTAASTQQISGTVADAAQEASAHVQSVASAAEELTSSVNDIARQVQDSSAIAREAVMQAETTDSRITALSQAASRIGDVVKLITAIAEQTNLLALNATIEAARAGDAGKGFAVVAQEVKALAAQTAKATEEIGTQIAGMQTATQTSVAAIKEIGATIARISQIAATIAGAVEEQSAATQEIARAVNLASQGTSHVAMKIADVMRGAAETGSASTQVLSSARELSNEGSRLKLEVRTFLDTVRAA